LEGKAKKSEDREQRSDEPITNNREPITGDRELWQRLRDHPLAKAPQKLLALDLQEHVDASRRDELIGQGIAQWKNGDASELVALATWLNGKKEFEKTLEAIPLEKALLGRDLFLQYLDALGGLDRWSEIKQLLENDRYPLDPVVQHMYLARCNAQLGEKTAGENNWQRALEAAAGDPGKQITVGEYAEKNGIVDVAQSAFDNATQESPRLRMAQQGRLRLAQQSGDTNKIHAVLTEMLKIWPNDAAVQNDEGYTRLLLMSSSREHGAKSREQGIGDQKTEDTGQRSELSTSPPLNSSIGDELAAILDVAAKLVEKNPRSLPHRTFLALARLKQNRPADALAVYENITVTRGALTPSALAVHAAVLAANGRKDEARTEAAQVKPEQLLPEERALLPSY
jgi:tetratricopeptide (TPR) repeat protein